MSLFFFLTLPFLIVSAVSLLNYQYKITDSKNRILDVSQGYTHLTVLYAPNSSSTNVCVDIFNITTNSTIQIQASTTQKIIRIHQLLGANTLQNNSYLLELTSGTSINRKIMKSNLTTTSYSWTQIKTSFVQYSSYVNCSYEFINNGSNRVGNRIYNNNANKFLQNSSSYEFFGFSVQGHKIYTLVAAGSGLAVVIFNFNSFSTNETMGNMILISMNSSYTNLKIDTSEKYIAVGFGSRVLVYNITSNSLLCNFTVPYTITDLRVSSTYIYATTYTTLYQYRVNLCKLFDTYVYTMSMISIFIALQQPSIYYSGERVFLWRNDTNASIEMLQTSNSYTCSGGCSSCVSGYQVNVYSICEEIGATPPSNTTNTTNAANTTNTTNSTTETNETNETQTNSSVPPPPFNIFQNFTQETNTTIINSTIPPEPVSKTITEVGCYQQYGDVCINYCSYKCLTCSPQQPYGICLICANSWTEVSPGQCQLSSNTVATVAATTIFNTFRITAIQGLFFIIDKIEMYQYHKIKYTGMTASIIQQINFASNNQWSFLPFGINDFVQRPYNNFPYQLFTHPKYFQAQHIDSLLFQTLKPFYTVLIPFTLVFFFACNKVFTILFNYSISNMIRIYSFKTQYLVLIFLSNAPMLCFSSITHFQLMFSISSIYKFLHVACVSFIGIFFICFICLFFMSEYFHGDLCKYFLPNVFRIDFSIAYTFFRFCLISMLTVIIHLFMYNYGSYQLLLLGVVETSFLIVSVFLEINLDIFKSKTIFLFDSVTSFCMALYNFSLWTKHYVFDTGLEEDTNMMDVIEEGIVTLIYTMQGIILLALFFTIFEGIFMGLLECNRKKDVIFNLMEQKMKSQMGNNCKIKRKIRQLGGKISYSLEKEIRNSKELPGKWLNQCNNYKSINDQSKKLQFEYRTKSSYLNKAVNPHLVIRMRGFSFEEDSPTASNFSQKSSQKSEKSECKIWSLFSTIGKDAFNSNAKSGNFKVVKTTNKIQL